MYVGPSHGRCAGGAGSVRSSGDLGGASVERLRSLDALVFDGAWRWCCSRSPVVTVFTAGPHRRHERALGAHARDDPGHDRPGRVRRSRPLLALVIGCSGILVQITADWPEGATPMAVLLLTYTVAACGRLAAGRPRPRRPSTLTLVVLGFTDAPGLDTLGVVGNIATFTVAWTVGIALRARRGSLESRVREAEERAESSARPRLGRWPRSGSASPRSCTTSWPTRCRSSPCRPASAPT